MLLYYVILGAIFLVSWLVSNRLQSKFAHYSQVQLRNGMSGKEIAEKMLRDNGINDVSVISTPGQLTDHYNPLDKTVNLSEAVAVYNQRNAAAAAVAAHECGHAVEHAQAYRWLTLRSQIVPAVNISSNLSNILIMIGFALGAFSKSTGFGYWIAVAGVALFAITTLFTFITLPVEYDASNRALAWLKNKNIVTREEYAGAEDSLKWAARTYVVAALGSLAQLLYWVYRLMGSSRDE